MKTQKIRTRFAPSPTGMMHIGNLRTALYAYLAAKSLNGSFILRIEDTDRGRLVEGSVEVIYKTLSDIGLHHDEGPDIGGSYGPYIQSERKDLYLPYALQLIEENKAYYCFCSPDKQVIEDDNDKAGYNRHCRNLSKDQVEEYLKEGRPFAIRQKMPLEGVSTFVDEVYGKISIQNEEIEDQIIIKSDGYPTYNFANVIDDHLMNISHVIRGSEYLSSTPKYNLLYEALGWEIPKYIHLPLIMGKNEDGTVAKLSKRHGSTGYNDLIKEGFLKEAILNYIVLLGWSPQDNVEIMSLHDMIKNFKVSGVSKSPAIFDYDKLRWFNSEYFKRMPAEDFRNLIKDELEAVNIRGNINIEKLSELVQSRINQLTQVGPMIEFLRDLPSYPISFYEHKKMKSSPESSLEYMEDILPSLEALEDWSTETIHNHFISYAKDKEIKNGMIMWPVRTAVSGLESSPGGAIELLYILGKDESLARIKAGINLLKENI